uniref:Agouti domain-containing protein n=1 Tax=Neogobius melanostomus TaxID=47308 RepID=A0A8C6T1I0_9GOBI
VFCCYFVGFLSLFCCSFFGLFENASIERQKSEVFKYRRLDWVTQMSQISLLQSGEIPGRLRARRHVYFHCLSLSQKPKFPVKPTPPKPAVKPPNPQCSLLTQSCLPQDGCCDAWASCHCHFFNAICFCRRTGSLHPRARHAHNGQT